MNALKSIGAVFAGMVVIVFLSAGTDFILESNGIFTPPEEGFFTPWMVMLAFFYRCVYTITGGYVTARLAPANPVRHSIILGLIGTVLGLIGVVVAWDLSPHWYPIALAVTAVPLTWLGGKLKK